MLLVPALEFPRHPEVLFEYLVPSQAFSSILNLQTMGIRKRGTRVKIGFTTILLLVSPL
jgi:hypothetical protein